jgi:hypothetical protein
LLNGESLLMASPFEQCEKRSVQENDSCARNFRSQRVHEFDGAMRFGELLFELVFNLQVCAKRQGDGANAIEAGVRAQQFSGGGLESGQGLFDNPSFANQPIDTATVFLCWVHGNASFLLFQGNYFQGLCAG